MNIQIPTRSWKINHEKIKLLICPHLLKSEAPGNPVLSFGLILRQKVAGTLFLNVSNQKISGRAAFVKPGKTLHKTINPLIFLKKIETHVRF